MRKQKVEIDIRTPDADPAEADAAHNLGTLFSLTGESAKAHARTRVYRIEPIDEGILPDRLSPDADEDTVFRKFGGGKFRLQAVNEAGEFLLQKTITLAGEPRFQSVVSRRRYERWLKESGLDADTPAIAVDIEEARDARHTRDLTRIKAESDAALARVRAELDAKEAADERRRQREREAEDARRDRERAEARAEREAEREARAEERREAREADDRRWQAEMAERRAARDERGDPLQQMAGMIGLIAPLLAGSGAAPEDPITAIGSRIPEILHELRETGAAIAASGKPAPRQNSQARVDGKPGEPHVTLEGPVARKAIAAIRRLESTGRNPEAILGQFFEAAARAPTRPTQPDAAGSTPAPPLRPAPHPRRATSPARRGKATPKATGKAKP